MWNFWKKKQKTGFFGAKLRPLNNCEEICVFYKTRPLYNPHKTDLDRKKVISGGGTTKLYSTGKKMGKVEYIGLYPTHHLEYGTNMGIFSRNTDFW